MFGIFKKNSIQHPILGDIKYSFGKWVGKNAKLFETNSVEIRIPGNKQGPSSESINSLFELAEIYPSLKSEIANTLFNEHYIHGKAAFDAGEFEDAAEDFPDIESPNEIWENVSLVRVLVEPFGKKNQIEIAYQTEWDFEHTLGFIIEQNKIASFCGSVGP